MKSIILSLSLLAGLFQTNAFAAPIRVENHSTTDTLFVAAILEQGGTTPVTATGAGFWKIEPGTSVTLAPTDANVSRAWLRLAVKSGANSREILPINSEYLDLKGSRDCRWSGATPATFTCVAQRRFSVSGTSLTLTLGSREQANNLRLALEKQGHYKFFKFDRNSSRELVYIWK
jgi:hypothetical protein